MALCEKIISFNKNLQFDGILPGSIQIMNPFKDNPEILPITEKFYKKYYNDTNPRTLLLGINPGRLGAGMTGIPFTDTQRLEKFCKITIDKKSYEPSSEFVYTMIEEYGGVIEFYSSYYINSICPLGFTRSNEKGKQVNCNYYDYPELTHVVYNFIVQSLKTQLNFGLNTEVCYCLGSGENYQFLTRLNKKENLFKKIVPLAHPRFIMQYKRKHLPKYIKDYLEILK